MSKQPPHAPTASAAGPCPTIIQVRRMPQYWKFTQHYRTTRPPQNDLRVRTFDLGTFTTYFSTDLRGGPWNYYYLCVSQ